MKSALEHNKMYQRTKGSPEEKKYIYINIQFFHVQKIYVHRVRQSDRVFI